MVQAEVIAKVFFETMYPGKSWKEVHRKSSVRVMLMVAAGKVSALFDAQTQEELFDHKDGGRPRGWPPNFRDEFWGAYPHKVGKGDAIDALEALSRSKDRPTWDILMAGLRYYIQSKPLDRAYCNPAKWIRHQRWLDQPAVLSHNGERNRNGFANIAVMEDD